MADPVEPSAPPPSSPPPNPRAQSTSTGLPSNIAAALATIPLVGGIIFYVFEKHDSFVRFYAMQSIIFGGAWIVINIGCAIILGFFSVLPVIGGLLAGFWGLLWWLVNLALFVIFVVALIKAFTGVRWEIPYIGPMARKQVGEI
jgi:uncharacterized membrane protein